MQSQVLDDSSYERAYAGCRQAVDGTSKDPVMATAVCSGVSSTPAAVEGVGNGGGGAGALSAQRGSTVHVRCDFVHSLCPDISTCNKQVLITIVCVGAKIV